MAFTHIQGNSATAGNGTTVSVVLPVNPTPGNLVCVGMVIGGSSLTAKDANNNVYTITPHSHSPFKAGVWVWLAYLLSAPANADKTITATWTGGVTPLIWADEFSYVGPVVFDTDTTGIDAVQGTTVNIPVITPTYSSSLLYACAGGHTISAPAAGATLGVWTGSDGAIQGNGMAEYVLSGSGPTPVNFTQTTGDWSAMAMAFAVPTDTIALTGRMNLGIN